MKKLVLLYNFSEERTAKIRRSALPLKIGVRVIERADYHQPVGVLFGDKDFQPVEGTFNDIPFADEMLLMYGFSRRDIDNLIRALNKNGVGRIPLKAVVTPTNIWWDSMELHSAIVSDHQEMARRNQKS